MMKRTTITYPLSLKEWHLHVPQNTQDSGGFYAAPVMSTQNCVRIQNRLYAVLEIWRGLLEQHFGISCRWYGLHVEQGPFSQSCASQNQIIYLLKDPRLSFAWSFDDRLVRYLLAAAFGLGADDSGQLGNSEMEQLFYKQLYSDTICPILSEMGLVCSEPVIQNGQRESNPLIVDTDTYSQFCFELRVPSLNETLNLTLSFTDKMLDEFMKLPVVSPSNQIKVVLSPSVLAEIFVPVEARLGQVDVTLGELKDVQFGDVLLVSRDISESVDLTISRELAFKGALGLVGKKLGIQLVDFVNGDFAKMSDDIPNILDNEGEFFEQASEENSQDEFVSVLDDPQDQSEYEFDWEKL